MGVLEVVSGRSLIIDWGSATRQRLSGNEIVEFLPGGHVRDFSGYDDIVLDFDELQNIVKSPGHSQGESRRLRIRKVALPLATTTPSASRSSLFV